MASYVRRSSSPKKRTTARRRSPGRELQSKVTARKASPAQKRAANNARIRRARAAKRGVGKPKETFSPEKARAPKKATRKVTDVQRRPRGGASSASKANQEAYRRFMKMTPAQRKYVIGNATKRSAR